MRDSSSRTALDIAGIRLAGGPDMDAEIRAVRAMLASYGLASGIESIPDAHAGHMDFRLNRARANEWVPDHDTMGLARACALDTHRRTKDLECEILIAMLAGPVAFSFPTAAELRSAVHIRRNIVQAGRQTVLAFDTEHAERPMRYWAYSEAAGFTLRPGQSLVTALQASTQPGGAGPRYSFSCYRATEYVILLGLAQELAECNPRLHTALEQQWTQRAIVSGEFHDRFLHEYGSLDQPLPFRYYVPGDRVWFRNPDEVSAGVEGYEGSWVIYLGQGLFTNFWKPGEPYTFEGKCLEIHHWRHALRPPSASHAQPWIDEEIVDARVAASLRDPDGLASILHTMMRVRDPSGVYQEGGCIDASREYVRSVHPGSTGLVLLERDLPKAA